MFLLALLFVHCCWGLLGPLTKPNGDLDMGRLSDVLAAVEKSMSYLQAEGEAAEMKNAAVLTQVLSKLKQSETDLANVRTELGAVKHEFEETKSKLVNTTSELEETRDRITHLEDGLTSRASNITKAHAVPRVAFQASVLLDDIHQHDQHFIKFRDVAYDSGSALKDGVFIAPVAGTYVLWATIAVHFRQYKTDIGLRIKTGNKMVGAVVKTPTYTSRGNGSVPDVHDTVSVTVVVELMKDMQVDIVTNYISYLLPKFSSFGGALLN